MNKYDCKSEKTSSRTMGLIMLALAAIIGTIGAVIIPVLGLIFSVPLLILAGLFFVAPESRVCKLILEKR
jgi:uncharacterized membrane protein YvlD (DUF360 family)